MTALPHSRAKVTHRPSPAHAFDPSIRPVILLGFLPQIIHEENAVYGDGQQQGPSISSFPAGSATLDGFLLTLGLSVIVAPRRVSFTLEV